MSLGSYLSSQSFHPFERKYELSGAATGTCRVCGTPREWTCHPVAGSIALENTYLGLAHLIQARQALQKAIDVLNVGGPTAGEICMNIGQRLYSLESIENSIRQARVETPTP